VTCAKAAEPLEIQFMMLSRLGPGNTWV